MSEKKDSGLFNSIAPIYGLFYKIQKKNFRKTIEQIQQEFDILEFKSIIDIGCGTGAFCSVLNEKGMSVTGIDAAEKMLKIARSKPENKDINFFQADILEKLPFEDNHFEIAITSYVAHGLKQAQRKQMYAEMGRVAKKRVIIHDYNNQRSFGTSLIEWLEGGDYFHFIRHAEPEMKDCMTKLKPCFSEVRVVNVGVRANWYICKPLE
jgi:ubiquinone/menaquinone biosynthesis C-methylase UbiE